MLSTRAKRLMPTLNALQEYRIATQRVHCLAFQFDALLEQLEQTVSVASCTQADQAAETRLQPTTQVLIDQIHALGKQLTFAVQTAQLWAGICDPAQVELYCQHDTQQNWPLTN